MITALLVVAHEDLLSSLTCALVFADNYHSVFGSPIISYIDGVCDWRINMWLLNFRLLAFFLIPGLLVSHLY